MECGMWNMEYGIWNMEYGIWNLEYGIWNMEYGLKNTEYGIWNLGNIKLKLIMEIQGQVTDNMIFSLHKKEKSLYKILLFD